MRTRALPVAWAFVLMLAAMAGTVIGHHLWPLGVFLLWSGLLVMLRNAGNHPLPDDRFVDIVGAVAMSWAAMWPWHFFKR